MKQKQQRVPVGRPKSPFLSDDGARLVYVCRLSVVVMLYTTI
jgi:hypothetical protein